jgi:ribosomal protein S18 acetylase RimI-like enzyme
MVEIREFTEDDYDEAVALWRASPGITLSEADAREAIVAYLRRNPGLSFAARDGGVLVAAVLCGHDGRRGYLHHLAVAPSHRGAGLARALASRCVEALRELGLRKCHLFVTNENAAALAFWRRVGWSDRRDVTMLTHVIQVPPRSPTAPTAPNEAGPVGTPGRRPG